MRGFTFLVSAALTIAGILAGIGGVVASEFKPVLIGFVLLTGAAVFALLYVGTRRLDVPAVHPEYEDLHAEA